MSGHDWEASYTAVDNLFGARPSTLLQSCAHLLAAGQKALAVGDGEGRNGVWLAEQGLEVLSVDLSPTALKRARDLARQRGVDIETLCADLCQWHWPEEAFDVVALIFVHFPPPLRRNLHHHMSAALKPGGLVIIEAFHVTQLQFDTGGPDDPAMLYHEDLLLEDFSGLEVLKNDKAITEVVKAGEPAGEGMAMRFVARRPAK